MFLRIYFIFDDLFLDRTVSLCYKVLRSTPMNCYIFDTYLSAVFAEHHV